MNEPLAYLDGQLIPASAATVKVYDAGFVLGATVTEQLRTFGGEIFRLPEHLDRLKRSLDIVGLQPQESLSDIAEIAQRLVANNHAQVDPADDLGLCIFITPGPYAAMAEGDPSGPLVGLHTYRLPFALWAERYLHGVALRTTPVHQVPAACWPSALKCRSRMHYYLADRAAAEFEPGARALLLDEHGYVSETSTANVVACFGGVELVSPPIPHVLPGISLQVVTELAGNLGIAFTTRNISPEEMADANEAFLTSTPNCLLPVTRLNGQSIGAGRPGDVFQRLMQVWNKLVGLDIAAQAQRFAQR